MATATGAGASELCGFEAVPVEAVPVDAVPVEAVPVEAPQPAIAAASERAVSVRQRG